MGYGLIVLCYKGLLSNFHCNNPGQSGHTLHRVNGTAVILTVSLAIQGLSIIKRTSDTLDTLDHALVRNLSEMRNDETGDLMAYRCLLILPGIGEI